MRKDSGMGEYHLDNLVGKLQKYSECKYECLKFCLVLAAILKVEF